MSFASSNRTALRSVKETVFGTTPASPAMQDMRYTGESLNYNLSNVVSDEIRSDRMTSALVQTQSDAAGDVNMEISHASYDDWLEGALAATFATAVAISGATDITAATTGDTFTATITDWVAEGIVVGQWIKIAGFTESANNGYHRVLTVSTTVISVNSNLVDEASGDSISVDGSMLRNGTTLSSFTLQKHLQDPTTPTYINFTGARVGGLNMQVQPGQIVGGSFSFMALAAATATSQFASATEPAATTTDPMNAVGNIATVWLDDASSTSYFNNLSITLNNNLRAQDAIGNLPHVGIALGTLDISGNIGIYFEDSTLYANYLAATSFSLAFSMEDAAGNAYIFTLPNIKFESGDITAGGKDQDVMFDATWKAIMDSTTSAMIQIDKF